MRVVMAKLLPLIVLFGLCLGCSALSLSLRTNDSSRDTFREESFLRYSHNRLKKFYGTPYEGLAKCHEGEHGEGLEQLRKQLAVKKDRPDYWNEVGLCYFMAKNYPIAAFYFDLAIKKSPKGRPYIPAFNNRGVLHLQLGHYQQAQELFKAAHKKNPKLKVPQFNLAQIYLRFYLLGPAKEILQKLHKENDQDVDVIHSLGSLYLLEGNLSRSEALFKSIPREFQERQDIAWVRALSYYQQKKYRETLKVLKKYDLEEFSPLKESVTRLMSLTVRRMKELEEGVRENQLSQVPEKEGGR